MHVGAVFVTKLTPDGAALAYSTFLGGGCPNDMSYRCGLALDGAGNAYVAGVTQANDYPTTPGAFQTTCHNCDYYLEGFVTKLNADGSALVYSTFLGGSGDDWAGRVVVDTAGAAYVTGFTNWYDFPTTPGAFDTSYNGGDSAGDVFVTKLAPDGAALEYSTFLGGSQNESMYLDSSIAIDGAGAAYVTGNTQSADFPTTPGAFNRSFQGGGSYNTDAFVTKLAPDGAALVYSTFLGGACADGGRGIQVDAAGRACLAGSTCSPDFPTTPDAYDPVYHFSDGAAFVTTLDAPGASLGYSTFLGGSGWSSGRGLVVDVAGAAHVVGMTDSPDFPTTPGAFDRTYHGSYDFFLAKLAPHTAPRTWLPVVLMP